MTIEIPDPRGVSQSHIERANESRAIDRTAASGSAPVDNTPSDDSIALGASSDLVQQALTAGSDARGARVQQLRQLIQTNQYPVDAASLSQSIIRAHVAGD